ncbi:prepilin-type N-terminal cleavage/methylation domain-containing protein, partial [Candidatus Saccharibacteria bacterium]|nr:prepilin-type N-terminal cleavage/methylation domain-containing protein [Candidatus Saccharibacteria bacterium]
MKKAWAPKQKHGFTIVELLIVIVVIAILAAISIVAYNGIQSRGRDSIRKQDLATLAKVTHLYQVDQGDYAQAGCGSTSASVEGSGWLHSDYDGSGSPQLSINDCLLNAGVLQKPLKDPSGQDACGGASCHAYMKSSCAAGTWYLANLETLP